VREQRTIAQAAPVVDRAAGEIVAAAFADADATVEVSGRRLTAGCRLTSAWDGAELERVVTARTDPATAPAVLDRIADRLPAAYRVAVRHAEVGEVHRLRADAGDFVAVTGGVTSPGVISLTVGTGCRPPSPDFDPEDGEPVDGSAQEARINLIGLGAAGVRVVDVAVVPCPGGDGVFVSQAATGRGRIGPELRAAARQGRVVIDEADHFAFTYAQGTAGVREADGTLTATSTEARCESGAPRGR
jgi:hypothetical protein